MSLIKHKLHLLTKIKRGKVESNTVDVLELNNIAWYRSSAEQTFLSVLLQNTHITHINIVRRTDVTPMSVVTVLS